MFQRITNGNPRAAAEESERVSEREGGGEEGEGEEDWDRVEIK